MFYVLANSLYIGIAGHHHLVWGAKNLVSSWEHLYWLRRHQKAVAWRFSKIWSDWLWLQGIIHKLSFSFWILQHIKGVILVFFSG